MRAQITFFSIFDLGLRFYKAALRNRNKKRYFIRCKLGPYIPPEAYRKIAYTAGASDVQSYREEQRSAQRQLRRLTACSFSCRSPSKCFRDFWD